MRTQTGTRTDTSGRLLQERHRYVWQRACYMLTNGNLARGANLTLRLAPQLYMCSARVLQT